MKIDLESIKTTINKERDELKNNYHVSNVGIFGSVARGENLETSDIDVLVSFSKPISMFTFIRLEDHLSILFGKKVDLVTEKALKAAIKDEVLHEVKYV